MKKLDKERPARGIKDYSVGIGIAFGPIIGLLLGAITGSNMEYFVLAGAASGLIAGAIINSFNGR